MSQRPSLCSRCGKLMGTDPVCPHCGADHSGLKGRLMRMAAANRRASGEGDGPSVTGVLVVLNLFFYVSALIVSGTEASGGIDVMGPSREVLFQLGLQFNPAIAAGDWWRLVTMIFLHLGLLHVLFNCYVLWMAGRLVEAEFGPRLMFLLYMVAGLVGSIASYVVGINGAGASGAVFGLLGAIVVRRRLVDGNFRHPVTQQLLMLVGINVVLGLAMAGHINNVAHFGGLGAGAGMAWLLTTVRLSRGWAVLLMLGTWAAAAGTVVSLGLMILGLFRGGPSDAREANRCWKDVQAFVEERTRGDAPFEPKAAKRVEGCLEELPRLESPANRARAQAAEALRSLRKAWKRGDSAGQSRALEQLREAVAAYAAWMREAWPRYLVRPWLGPE